MDIHNVSASTSTTTGGDILTGPQAFLLHDENNQEFSKKNLARYRELVDKYRLSPNEFVTFVGSGTSKNLGLLDWKGLLERLKTDVQSDGFEGLDNFDLETVMPEEYPAIAEVIAQAYENKGSRGDFFDAVDRLHHISETVSTTMLMNLVKAFSVHLTTNFDLGIVEAHNAARNWDANFKRDLEVHRLPNMDRIPSLEADSVYYLHANADEKIYILAENEYVRYYGTVNGAEEQPQVSSMKTCFKNFLKDRNVVFVGFGFQDIYVRKMVRLVTAEIRYIELEKEAEFKRLGKVHKQNTPVHFALLHGKAFDSGTEARSNELMKYGIKSVYYTQHRFLDEFFEFLANQRQTGDVSAFLQESSSD